ncbi:GNAT family N-acetyltransferase [Acidocella sp.]|uniref:GNAT family N-acetyltransferase n=1 Tax=Acidocella sp. TaxID=50710 RepID=UPI002636E732|nr:GNAT family N-acetyltransferase [Acidocella sp.]
MSPAYAAAFAALHAGAFADAPWDEASFATMLAQPGMHGFLDERGGFLLLRIVLDEAEIITIGVTAPRQGIATTLLDRGIAACRAAGVTRIHLEVAERNTPARAFYAARGFISAGRRKSYYADGADALTLTLDLG